MSDDEAFSLDGPPLLVVDLDGTIRQGKDDELGRFVNGPEDVVVFPEAVTMMTRWKEAGGLVYGVTNQAGVASGYMTYDQCFDAVMETTRQADDLLSDVFICPHATDADCFCRKPLPGMVISALISAAAEHGMPLRSRCLMVGDRPEDEQAAQAAGMPFEWAAMWRSKAA